jgi:peptide deformylase
MKRDICRMGNPVLRVTAEKVVLTELNTPEFKALLEDMNDSMKASGGIGIAAPQIGVSKQIALIELKGINRYNEFIDLPLTTFINPEIEVLDQTTQGFWEGCLSVPGMRGFVERPRHVKVRFVNEKGEEQVLEAEGFLATVIQHELDHLFGTLYIDRIKDPKLFMYQEEFDKYIGQTAID